MPSDLLSDQTQSLEFGIVAVPLLTYVRCQCGSAYTSGTNSVDQLTWQYGPVVWRGAICCKHRIL